MLGRIVFRPLGAFYLLFKALYLRINSTGKKWKRIKAISLKFTEFLKKVEFSNFLFYFFRLFLCYFYSDIRKFLIISLSSTVQIWGVRVKFFSRVFSLYFEGYVDPHNFADPDPGSQNLKA